jgi:beta-glucosidase
LLARVRRRCDRLVVILLSGRPLIVTAELDQWDAFVAAWLPGTEADGIADLLFGWHPFTGRLSFAWPRSMDQVPLAAMGEAEPLFPLGFGLVT